MLSLPRRSRFGARYRSFNRPVSPNRFPNPPCPLLSNGLSTSPAVLARVPICCDLPGRGDSRPPVPVSCGSNRSGVEQLGLSRRRPPSAVAVTSAESLPACFPVFPAQPCPYLAPYDLGQVLEGLAGYSGPEVLTPASQHRVQPVQQDR